uniref:Uncharacterized protein n=1 Tax=Nelumbo nucifera TaxID=4432 RepID=A0A822YE95_NELNU|nr:TPA_asm: hypothetical protein HUJ06_031289 [Nelumbo nucifera]
MRSGEGFLFVTQKLSPDSSTDLHLLEIRTVTYLRLFAPLNAV